MRTHKVSVRDPASRPGARGVALIGRATSAVARAVRTIRRILVRGTVGVAAAGAGPAPWVSVFGAPAPVPGDLMAVNGGWPFFGATDLERRVRVLLADLGSAPGEVAASLHAARVRGEADAPTSTPIGRYLCAVIGADAEVRHVSTDGRSVTVTHVTGRSVTIALPPAVAIFAEAFEYGCYPELDVTPRRMQRTERNAKC
jgi:hypothetical protein